MAREEQKEDVVKNGDNVGMRDKNMMEKEEGEGDKSQSKRGRGWRSVMMMLK